MSGSLLLGTALAAGFFGSVHCFAMCGALVLLFEGSQQAGSLSRRIACNAGRMLFYVILGVIAGTSGALLVEGFSQGLMILRIVAALLIIAIGLNLAFNWQALQFIEAAGAVIWRRISPLARHVVPIRSLPGALAAGILWGALPCGLVYSSVALAMTGGSALSGGLVMFAFWAGTLPALLMAGASASRLHLWKSRPLPRRISGFVMIAFGTLSLLLPLQHSGNNDHAHHAAISGAACVGTDRACL